MALRASCGGGNRSSSYATHQTDWREGCPRFEPIPKTPLPNPPLPSQEREQRPAASAAPTGLVADAHAARTAASPGARAARRRHLLRCASDRTRPGRSEEHTSELQSLMRTSYAVFCLIKKKKT